MSVTKTLLAATAASAFAATSAFAGGFADEITEAPVVAPTVMVEPAAPAGSIPGWVIPAALAAALIAVAVSGDDSED